MNSQPANASAREIVRLRSINADLSEQKRVLTEREHANLETIGALAWSAIWADGSTGNGIESPPEVAPPVLRPEPEPEPEPEEQA